MLRLTSRLLASVILCGIGQAGLSIADGAPVHRSLAAGTVELVGVTNFPPTNQSRWWKPDGSLAQIGPFRAENARHTPSNLTRCEVVTFLVRSESLSADALTPSWSRNMPADASAPSSTDDMPPDTGLAAFGINPYGPSWDVYYVAHHTTLGQQTGLFTPYYQTTSVVDVARQACPKLLHVFCGTECGCSNGRPPGWPQRG